MKIVAGEVIGRLGHSGDTDTPHVHYQLQSARNSSMPMRCRATLITLRKKILIEEVTSKRSS